MLTAEGFVEPAEEFVEHFFGHCLEESRVHGCD